MVKATGGSDPPQVRRQAALTGMDRRTGKCFAFGTAPSVMMIMRRFSESKIGLVVPWTDWRLASEVSAVGLQMRKKEGVHSARGDRARKASRFRTMGDLREMPVE